MAYKKNEKLEKELEEIEKRLKGDFISPKDFRRKQEILFELTGVRMGVPGKVSFSKVPKWRAKRR